MGYQVEIDWSPPHELILSLMAYVNAQTHKVLDLGPAWVKEVRQRLPEGFAEDVRVLREKAPLPPIIVQMAQSPADIPGFLGWVRQRTPEEILSLVVQLGGPPLPLGDLAAARDQWARVLALWHERYFQGIDPAILSGLQAEADSLRARARTAGADPATLVSEATGGLRIEPTAAIEQVLLVPQYHYRPLNITDWYPSVVMIAYPKEALPLAEGVMPPGLRRLLRALDDDSRLQILRALSGRPLSFTEVVERSGLAKSTVHHHLVTLRAAGLVWCHVTGSFNDTYSLRPEALDRLSPELRLYLKGE